MNRRHKFAALTWWDRLVLFQSLMMLPATALGIKVLGVQRWQNALVWRTKTSQNSVLKNSPGVETSGFSLELQTQRAKQIARLVRAAANHGLYNANCLEQSVVLWFLLQRHGLKSEIRFGARKEESELKAHAWVECFGIALNEDRGVEQRYAPFAAIPQNKAGEPLLSEAVRSR